MILFTRITIANDLVSINLSNYSFQLKKTEIDVTELEEYIKSYAEFTFDYANIYHTEKSIEYYSISEKKTNKIRYSELNEDILIDIVERLIENIPFTGEIN